MKVVLVTNYWYFPSERQSERNATLAQMLVDAGHQVEVVTSTFRHATKKQRHHDALNEALDYSITMIPEPGYVANLSLRRLLSHWTFARRVVRYLRTSLQADVIYCSVPPLDLGNEIGKYARKHSIPLVLDVRDLWPEGFRMALKDGLLFRVATYPLKRQADRTYSRANSIVAVSDTYRRRARGVSAVPSRTVFLGVDLDSFDRHVGDPIIEKSDGEIWLAYAGTLAHSYDLKTALKAYSMLPSTIRQKTRLVVMGDGPLRKEFETEASALAVDAIFTGQLPYHEMVAILKRSDVALNPIVPASEASIINKHGDYLAAALPIVNNQRSPEFASLLEAWDAGVNCEPGSASAMARALEDILSHPALMSDMGKNARALAERHFDRNRTFLEIIEAIETAR